jgi:hypothetical protein
MSKWVSIVTSALPEEVVSAVAVPEIVVSPWFPLRGGAAYDRTAVDESAVAQPLHQLTQIHPVFGIVELGGEPN